MRSHCTAATYIRAAGRQQLPLLVWRTVAREAQEEDRTRLLRTFFFCCYKLWKLVLVTETMASQQRLFLLTHPPGKVLDVGEL